MFVKFTENPSLAILNFFSLPTVINGVPGPRSNPTVALTFTSLVISPKFNFFLTDVVTEELVKPRSKFALIVDEEYDFITRKE